MIIKQMIMASICFLSMLCCVPAVADSADQKLFAKGNMLCQAGNHEQALSAYQAIKHKTVAVWYNAGMCLFLLQDYGQALVYWWRADRNATNRQREIHKQSRIKAQQALGIAQETDAHTVFSRIMSYLIGLFMRVPMYLLQLLVLLGWCMTIFLLHKHSTFVCVRRKWWLWVIACLINGCLIMALYLSYRNHTDLYGVIINATAIRVGPNEHYHQRGTAAVGTRVNVEQCDTEWCKIKDGITGWIPATAVTII